MKTEKAEAIRKRTPLETRLNVLFRCEWLLMNINPDRHATDEELLRSERWVSKMVQMTIRTIQRWENDGRQFMTCQCEKPEPDSLGYGAAFCKECNKLIP